MPAGADLLDLSQVYATCKVVCNIIDAGHQRAHVILHGKPVDFTTVGSNARYTHTALWSQQVLHGLLASSYQALTWHLSVLLQDVRDKVDHLTAQQRVGLKYYDDFEQRIPRDEATEAENIVHDVVADVLQVLEPEQMPASIELHDVMHQAMVLGLASS